MKNFKHVLFGATYIKDPGGVASVLSIYQQTVSDFNYIPTSFKRPSWQNILIFPFTILRLFFYLLTTPAIKIVHLHASATGSFYRKSVLFFIAKIFRKKTIIHIHSGKFDTFFESVPYLQGIIKYVLNKTDVLIVLSEEWKTYFDTLTITPKAVVVNNPVVMPSQSAPKIPATPYKLLYLSRINTIKGIYDLLEYFKNHHSALKNQFLLQVAGSGEEEKVKEIIKKEKLEDVVQFVGWISGEPKMQMIREADAFILVSYYEGLPMSILEAMAMGKAIIASRVGGVPSVVKDGVNGWLIAPKKPEELTRVFDDIRKDPEILYRFGQQSIALSDPYSSTKVVAHLDSIYEELLAGK
jgi:glycosyltransferase involved in cell wall biosynthesis